MLDSIDKTARIAGYTEFVLENLGPDMHDVQPYRLEGGHTPDHFMNTMAKAGAPPAWAIPAGGPNAPVPGGESRGIVKLRAGIYAIVCLIPAKDGVPHHERNGKTIGGRGSRSRQNSASSRHQSGVG